MSESETEKEKAFWVTVIVALVVGGVCGGILVSSYYQANYRMERKELAPTATMTMTITKTWTQTHAPIFHIDEAVVIHAFINSNQSSLPLVEYFQDNGTTRRYLKLENITWKRPYFSCNSVIIDMDTSSFSLNLTADKCDGTYDEQTNYFHLKFSNALIEYHAGTSFFKIKLEVIEYPLYVGGS